VTENVELSERSLAQHLASWAVIPGQIKSNVTKLLKILRMFYSNLPDDFRGLLKTLRKVSGLLKLPVVSQEIIPQVGKVFFPR
jgi:hypothetical protein